MSQTGPTGATSLEERGDPAVRALLDELVGVDGDRPLARGRVASRPEVRALVEGDDETARRFVRAAAGWAPGMMLQDTGAIRWTQLTNAAGMRVLVLRQVLALLFERPARFAGDAVELVLALARVERRTQEPSRYGPPPQEDFVPSFLARAPDPEAEARFARDAAHLKALDEQPLPVGGVVAVAEAAAAATGGRPSEELRSALAALAPRLRTVAVLEREPEQIRARDTLERLLVAAG
jgi:hypothetical protein